MLTSHTNRRRCLLSNRQQTNNCAIAVRRLQMGLPTYVWVLQVVALEGEKRQGTILTDAVRHATISNRSNYISLLVKGSQSALKVPL